jgi:hypothetical protein
MLVLRLMRILGTNSQSWLRDQVRKLTTAYLVVGWTHLGRMEGRRGQVKKEIKCKVKFKTVNL